MIQYAKLLRTLNFQLEEFLISQRKQAFTLSDSIANIGQLIGLSNQFLDLGAFKGIQGFS